MFATIYAYIFHVSINVKAEASRNNKLLSFKLLGFHQILAMLLVSVSNKTSTHLLYRYFDPKVRECEKSLMRLKYILVGMKCLM